MKSRSFLNFSINLSFYILYLLVLVLDLHFNTYISGVIFNIMHYYAIITIVLVVVFATFLFWSNRMNVKGDNLAEAIKGLEKTMNNFVWEKHFLLRSGIAGIIIFIGMKNQLSSVIIIISLCIVADILSRKMLTRTYDNLKSFQNIVSAQRKTSSESIEEFGEGD